MQIIRYIEKLLGVEDSNKPSDSSTQPKICLEKDNVDTQFIESATSIANKNLQDGDYRIKGISDIYESNNDGFIYIGPRRQENHLNGEYSDDHILQYEQNLKQIINELQDVEFTTINGHKVKL